MGPNVGVSCCLVTEGEMDPGVHVLQVQPNSWGGERSWGATPAVYSLCDAQLKDHMPLPPAAPSHTKVGLPSLRALFNVVRLVALTLD